MWSLIIHGGAKTIRRGEEERHRSGCREALAAGMRILARSGHALDAAEACVRALEDDPVFNAGYGSVLNAAGEVEMDAAIMDGTTHQMGAVAAIKGVRNPVSVARLLVDEPPILLVGDGARTFASRRGAELCAPEDMIARPHQAAGHDTVGCVALDDHGRVAVATSTGGLEGTLPGRVGDTPLPGCGFYADNRLGGVAYSGDGEVIARLTLAARMTQALRTSSVEDALRRSVVLLERGGGEGGGIAIDRDGRAAWHHNSSHFAVAYCSHGAPTPLAFVRKCEERHVAI